MLLYSECLPHVSYLARTLQIFWGHLLCSRHQAYKHMSPTRVSRTILHGFKQIEKWVSKNATGSSKLKGNISFRACQPNPLLMSVGVGFQESVKELRLHCSRWNQVSLCVHWQDLKRWKGSMATCHWRLKGCFWMPGTNPFRAPESLQCGELFHQGQELILVLQYHNCLILNKESGSLLDSLLCPLSIL